MRTTRKRKREALKKCNLFKDILKVIKHFWPDFLSIIGQVTDPRHQSYIVYSQECLLMTRMFSFFCNHQSFNHMNESFNKDVVIENFKFLFDENITEIPHGDTINNYLSEISIDELRKVLYAMLNRLIRSKVTDDSRINNKYHQIVIDGVNMFVVQNDQIDGGIERKHRNGKTMYHIDMLVAYMTLGNIVIPVDIEPIENVGKTYDKQDCEINAAKRLLKRMKKKFKRLPICISADALYLSEPMISLIEENHWKYTITYKENKPKELKEYYETLQKANDTNVHLKEQEKYEYYNGIEYKNKKINIISYTKRNKEDEIVEKFSYVTNIEIKETNYKDMVKICRKRWMIENQGFNELKNHGYYLSHIYSYNENAIKAHVIIMLISQMIMNFLRIYERKKGRYETLRKMGEEIKEALRNKVLSATDIDDITKSFYVGNYISYL